MIAKNKAEPERLYDLVAREITDLIKGGTLRPGDRVPSVRQMVLRREVSPATVLQAYQILEGRGLIEARPKSGFYVRAWQMPSFPVPPISRPPPGSQPLNMASLVMEVVGTLGKPGLVQLGAAVPPAELLPNRDLHRALSSAVRRQPLLANTCDPTSGLRTLRVEIARHALEAGCSLTPDDFIVLNGLTEGLQLCLRAVTRPGDTVAIESPTYFGILQVIEMLGLRVCEVPTRPDEGVSLEALEQCLSRERVKACVFMPNFSNPLGSCMPEANKKALVEMLGARRIPLIESGGPPRENFSLRCTSSNTLPPWGTRP